MLASNLYHHHVTEVSATLCRVQVSCSAVDEQKLDDRYNPPINSCVMQVKVKYRDHPVPMSLAM
jgi:hypothetical protein